LFRGLLLSEFADGRLSETYFNGHDFAGKVVADPFIGGGTPLIEANRIGCDVLGFDINPMATWLPGERISANRRRQTPGCGVRTATGSLKAIFESSDVERFVILMEVRSRIPAPFHGCAMRRESHDQGA
jgi:hypothetical protein